MNKNNFIVLFDVPIPVRGWFDPVLEYDSALKHVEYIQASLESRRQNAEN